MVCDKHTIKLIIPLLGCLVTVEDSDQGLPCNTVRVTVHDLKLSHFFQKKKLQKSVTIWEHLPKRYHFWTIIKQKKSVTIWKKV